MNDASSRRAMPRPVAPGAALLPLRLFLGATFVYAGIQKLSDPGFLHPGAPTYIGTQLRAFATHTPGGPLLRVFALPHVGLAGVGVALLEIAIGLLVAAGLLTRAAALAGLALNLVLFLTASWHTSPYFLGSDIVFVFAWMPLVLAGAAGQPALDNVLGRHGATTITRRPRPGDLTRRGALGRVLGVVGATTLGTAGVASLAKGAYHGPSSLAAGPVAGKAPVAKRAATSHPAAKRRATAGLPRGAVRLGSSRAVAPGNAAYYRDPGSGQADLLIRHTDGTLTAMSAICTHAGCQVGYQSGEIVCPCHGATYDADTGAVTGGPAPQGLARRRVVEHGGSIYAIPT
jgi:thiosulfate dehydrogenase (quinone) large subunit